MRTGSKLEWTLEILAGLFILANLFFAPLFHWLWFGIFVQNLPTVLLLLLWGTAVGLAFWRLDKGTSGFFWSAVTAIGMGTVILIAGAVFSGWTNETLYNDMRATTLSSMPETTDLRYLPLEVAEKYGQNKVQSSNQTLGTFNPMQYDNEIAWVAPRIPNGPWNSLFGKNSGFVVVPHTGDAVPVNQEVKYGESVVSDNILYALRQNDFFAYYPEIYWGIDSDEVIAVAPFVKYDFLFPTMIPRWGGVKIIHADGTIDTLSPEQARVDKHYSELGLPLFPEYLVKAYGTAVGFKHGMWNTWFTHADQAEVPTIADSENQMPYLTPFVDGANWVSAMQPWGAKGIYKMLYVNAANGDVSLYELPASSSLIGPNRALDYMKGAFPEFNWVTSSKDTTSGNVIVIEPRPIVRAKQLFWLGTVTTNEFAGVTRSVIVDASTGKLVYVDSYEDLVAWLHGQYAGRVPGNAPTPTPTPTPSATPAPVVQPSIVISGTDVSTMTDQQLIELIRAAANELEKRQAK